MHASACRSRKVLCKANPPSARLSNMPKPRIIGNAKYMRIKQDQLDATAKKKHILKKAYRDAKKRTSDRPLLPVRSRNSRWHV